MHTSHRVIRHGVGDVLVVALAGQIAAGSNGNADARLGAEYIEAHLTRDHAALVLDLTDLAYVWGDYAGLWWVAAAMRWRGPMRLVAAGRTARALMGLLETPGHERILGEPVLHACVPAALDSLPGS